MADRLIRPERIAEIQHAPHSVAFPPPPPEGLFVWAAHLLSEQLLAAVIIYTEKWMFDDGHEFFKRVMQALEFEIGVRGGLEPSIGDIVHSTVDNKTYYFNGREWAEFQIQIKGKRINSWETEFQKSLQELGTMGKPDLPTETG